MELPAQILRSGFRDVHVLKEENTEATISEETEEKGSKGSQCSPDDQELKGESGDSPGASDEITLVDGKGEENSNTEDVFTQYEGQILEISDQVSSYFLRLWSPKDSNMSKTIAYIG